MPLIETGSYMVCMDCYVLILTGDATHLDYYYDEVEADERLDEIESGISRLSSEGSLHDAENRDEFYKYPCDCCRSTLHGERREIRSFDTAVD